MKENQINQGLDDRITVHPGEFVIKKGTPGSHSLNNREAATKIKLQSFKSLCLAQGKKLEKRNNPAAKYYLVEDGTLVKALPDSFLYYRLDLTNYNWVLDPNLMTLFFDTYLRYQELPDFEDYYPDVDQDLNKGMNL